MTRNEIVERLTPIARTVFQQEEMVLTDDMSAQTVDAWTSLAFMQLLTSIEQQFGFKFKMMELLQLNTMGDIINAIAQHLD